MTIDAKDSDDAAGDGTAVAVCRMLTGTGTGFIIDTAGRFRVKRWATDVTALRLIQAPILGSAFAVLEATGVASNDLKRFHSI